METRRKIAGCLGFEVSRVYVHSDGSLVLRPDGSECRVKTFPLGSVQGPVNPDWVPQDTGVWPVQKLSWRDFTLRRSARPDPAPAFQGQSSLRDRAGRRPEARSWRRFPRRPSRSSSDPRTGVLHPAYEGTPRFRCYICGAAIETNEIVVTTDFGDVSVDLQQRNPRDTVLRKQLKTLMRTANTKPEDVEKHICVTANARRKYLAGDMLPLLRRLFERAPEDGLLALYELEDTSSVDCCLQGPGHPADSVRGQHREERSMSGTRRTPRAREKLARAGTRLQDRDVQQLGAHRPQQVRGARRHRTARPRRS